MHAYLHNSPLGTHLSSHAVPSILSSCYIPSTPFLCFSIYSLSLLRPPFLPPFPLCFSLPLIDFHFITPNTSPFPSFSLYSSCILPPFISAVLVCSCASFSTRMPLLVWRSLMAQCTRVAAAGEGTWSQRVLIGMCIYVCLQCPCICTYCHVFVCMCQCMYVWWIYSNTYVTFIFMLWIQYN